MRVVLYAEDFEPITVLELTEFASEHLKRFGMVRLAVMMPVRLTPPLEPPSPNDCKTVTIMAERLVRNGSETLMLFTRDDENALLLKSAFLPGQRRAVQEENANAFARGFLQALVEIGR